MAGKVFTAIVDIAGSLNPNVKKTIDKANKQMGALKVSVAAASAAFAAASVASGKYLLDLGDQFDGAQDSIRIGTGATGAALDALMGDFDSVLKALPTSTESAALAVADLNTKLGLQGKALQDVSKSAIYLSENLGAGELTAVIDTSSKALQSWNVAQGDMTAKMDYAFKVSQSTGAGYTDLMTKVQQYGATFRSLGYDFETSAAMIGQMSKAGVNVDEALSAMKKSLSAMTKEGINAADGFQMYYEQIFNAADATKAAQVASELFGTKAGPEMASAIRAGRLEASAFAAALMENGETIAGVAQDTFDYKEKLQMMKNTMDTALRPLASTVFNSLGDTMPYVEMLFQKLQPAIEKFGVVLPQIVSGAVGSIGFLVDNWAIIKPVVIGVTAAVLTYKGVMAATTIATKASAAATKIKTIWDKRSKVTAIAATVAEKAKTFALNAGAIATKGIAAAQWLVNAAMNANPIGLVVAGITALIAAGVLLWKNWDTVSAKARELWAGFTNLLDNMGGFGAAIKGFAGGWFTTISGVFTNVKGIFTGLIDFVKNVFTGNWAGAWNAVKSIFANTFGALTGLVKAPFNAIIGMVNGVIKSINGIGFTVPEWVPGLGGKAFSVNIPNIPMLAAGGITTGPSIAGEGGYPEYVISTDPQYRGRSIGLLERAAGALGLDRFIDGLERAPVYGGGGGASDRPIQVTFAPTIHATGDGKDILEQLRAQFPDFMDMVKKALEAEKEGDYSVA